MAPTSFLCEDRGLQELPSTPPPHSTGEVPGKEPRGDPGPPGPRSPTPPVPGPLIPSRATSRVPPRRPRTPRPLFSPAPGPRAPRLFPTMRGKCGGESSSRSAATAAAATAARDPGTPPRTGRRRLRSPSAGRREAAPPQPAPSLAAAPGPCRPRPQPPPRPPPPARGQTHR